METEMSTGELLFKLAFGFIAKSLLIMWMWNYTMPTFGLHELSFLQSVAVGVLGECIFQPWTLVSTKKAL